MVLRETETSYNSANRKFTGTSTIAGEQRILSEKNKTYYQKVEMGCLQAVSLVIGFSLLFPDSCDNVFLFSGAKHCTVTAHRSSHLNNIVLVVAI